MNLSSSLFTDVTLSIAVLVIILGAFATQIRRRAGSIPLFAMLAGVALSPLIPLSDLPQPAQFGILYDVASLALATGLFGSALALPCWDVLHHTRALLLMIGVVLPLMWLTAGAPPTLCSGCLWPPRSSSERRWPQPTPSSRGR